MRIMRSLLLAIGIVLLLDLLYMVCVANFRKDC
jgi:hypothetical protein